jgi:hypothetical protein
LVVTQNTLTEYTRAGVPVSSSIPISNTSEVARDVIVDYAGVIHVYNGTFSPYLSTYSPTIATWTHNTYPGWSTVNNVSYGGITRHRNHVYMSDMNTAGKEASGIVCVDTNTGAFERFADPIEYIDLALGFDGLLYGLEKDELTLDAYHPILHTLVLTVSLAHKVRGIAVATSGDIFGASWDGHIYHFDENGNTLDSTASGIMNLTDIDLACDGQLAIGSWSGEVLLSDESLDNVDSFSAGSNTTFVTFSTLCKFCSFAPLVQNELD